MASLKLQPALSYVIHYLAKRMLSYVAKFEIGADNWESYEEKLRLYFVVLDLREQSAQEVK